MKCLLVVPSLMRAGAEIQAVALANGLSSLGHSVHLFTFEAEFDLQARIANDVQFHHVVRKSKYDLAPVTALAEIIDREGIEIVQGVLDFATLVAWLAARRSRRKPPVVAAVHTTVNRGLKEELQERLLYRRLFRRLPAIVFVCQHQSDHWTEKYRELGPLARVVHNGVAVQQFRHDDFVDAARELRADLGIPENTFVFSCVAAFRPEKGHDLLIDAFSRISKESYLLLAGDGERRPEIEEQVTLAGLQDRTRFLGIVTDPRPVIVASNATILASTAETFSMVMLESMALGVPMIAPRIGGLPEAIIHGETGLLFSIGDIEALASCMENLVTSPAMARMMGEAADSKISDCFTLEKMLEGSERVLLEILRA